MVYCFMMKLALLSPACPEKFGSILNPFMIDKVDVEVKIDIFYCSTMNPSL